MKKFKCKKNRQKYWTTFITINVMARFEVLSLGKQISKRTLQMSSETKMKSRRFTPKTGQPVSNATLKLLYPPPNSSSLNPQLNPTFITKIFLD